MVAEATDQRPRLGQKGKTMDEIMIGTVPTSRPMTNEQRRIHRNLASAEKHLIRLLDAQPYDERITAAQISRAELVTRRLTVSWRKACA